MTDREREQWLRQGAGLGWSAALQTASGHLQNIIDAISEGDKPGVLTMYDKAAVINLLETCAADVLTIPCPIAAQETAK